MMGKGKKNRIKTSSPNQSQTKGRIAEPSSNKNLHYDDCHPVFCLRYLEDDYGLDKCTRDQQADFAKALRKRSQMTWRQIWAAPRHKLGAEKIAINSIKAQIPQHITEDIDFFIALRFSGKAPMVGYRIKDILRIIWLDSKFTLYEH
ncbi:MAG: hypothetical protein F6K47_07055 [Symploca sp. SIO2E6]|nr:hypothetical protein [Symploca sp. SIO2E6]